MTDRVLRSGVERGEWTRLRRGLYAAGQVDAATLTAARAGARVACVSELRRRGVWVLDTPSVHVELPRSASGAPADLVAHWRRSPGRAADPVHVSLTDALTQASRCLPPVAWIASIDSAWHQRMISGVDLDVIERGSRPASRRYLRFADPAAESGLESIVRVIARELGFRVCSQVRFSGVGRVDLVVEDRIVVETDGAAFHDVALSARDRRRDALLVSRGLSVLRPGYSLVVFDRPAVARQLVGAVASHREVKNSGHLAARARRRLEGLDLS